MMPKRRQASKLVLDDLFDYLTISSCNCRCRKTSGLPDWLTEVIIGYLADTNIDPKRNDGRRTWVDFD